MRIDAHQHFWRYNPQEHTWMTAAMGSLKRDFLPDDLAPLLRQTGVNATIAVQARQNVQETEWLLGLADQHPFISGVVGWVDLRSPQVPEQLEQYARHPKLVGVRHVVHDEPDDKFMLQPDFLRGLSYLANLNLTYDLLLFPRHLPIAVDVVQRFPRQRFVLDHIAKPALRERRLEPWRTDLRALAAYPNVYCKISGLVTEADWFYWRAEDFYPYLDEVFKCFGEDRLMFGSDWPVCTVSGGYSAVVGLVQDYIRGRSPDAQAKIFGGNAAAFYEVVYS
jgi:L-fuconolactonase